MQLFYLVFRDRMRSCTNYSVQSTCVVVTQRLCLSSLMTENKDEEDIPEINENGNGIQLALVVDDEKHLQE